MIQDIQERQNSYRNYKTPCSYPAEPDNTYRGSTHRGIKNYLKCLNKHIGNTGCGVTVVLIGNEIKPFNIYIVTQDYY